MAKNSKKKAKAQKKHKQAAAATAKNEGETPSLSNGLAPVTSLSVGVEPRAGKLLAANKQRAIVAQLLKQADAHGLRVGDKRFVVAAKWWERWCQYVGFDDANDSEDANDSGKNATSTITKSNSAQKPTNQISNGASHLASPPSKLNNLPLLQLPPPTDGPQLDALMGAPLRPQLKEGYHYTLLPEEVWDALLVWYGGGPAIARFVVEVGDPTLGNAFKRVEVYPELAGQQEEEETEEQKEEETSPAVETKTTLVRKPSASSSIPKICGACRATTGSLKRCGKCQVVWYCGAACQTAHWKFHKAVCRPPSASEDSEVVIHERMGHERRGKMGLRNLGNTCFMNSALQCLSHVEILTKYFLSNNYLKDLNRDNPLGTGGNLAVEYDSLLKELWFGSTTSTAPSSLKRAIGRFAPQFSGFQQHDSQELLAYILDGLHEDLNRVKQKPYTEVKESDGKQDDALVAKEAWERHLLRNDSIFVDHIQGQFKSTVVCPICAKVSITFDPYNCIQLELPIQQTRRMDAIVVPLDEPMKRYSVDVPKKGTVLALKRAVSKLCGLAANVMIAVDIYHSMVYRVIGDSERVARLRDEDRIVLYEVEPPVAPANDQDEPPQIYYGFLYHRADTALTGDPLLFTFYADTTCQEMLEKWSKMIGAHVTYQSGDSSATSIPPEVLSPCVFLGNRDGAFLRAEPVPASATSRFIDYATLQPNDSLDDIVYVSVAWSPTLLASPSAANYRPDVEFVLDHESVQLKDSQAARGDGISLYDCFRNFTKPETLDQANLWYCSKCKEHRQARKTMEIWKLPDVLIVSLKRFEYRNEVLRDKLDALVDFPLDGLDMAPFCLEPTSDAERLKYDLFAVSNHYGSMGFGHYTAFARSWQDGNGEAYPGWYSFDDSQVSPAMAGQVQSNAAYILFYKRRSMTTACKT